MRERRATLGLSPMLPGIALVLIIAWALAAVLMLTGTLVNAREIKETVPLINDQVSPIDKDLDNVKLAEKTAKISAKIRAAATPLVGQTDRIITAAKSIDGRVASILDTADSINGTVKSINDSVKTINRSVSSINGSVESINGSVSSIERDVLSINDSVTSINTRVTSINGRAVSIFAKVGAVGATDNSIAGSVTSIRSRLGKVDGVTRSIEPGITDINSRASRGITGVRGLKDDFDPIFTLVGSPGSDHSTAGPGNIHGHANAIDCAPLINSLGPTSYCNN